MLFTTDRSVDLPDCTFSLAPVSASVNLDVVLDQGYRILIPRLHNRCASPLLKPKIPPQTRPTHPHPRHGAPHSCPSHANPALNFVTPPPPAQRPATPPLTRPAHPCYASPNKGPTYPRPYDPPPRPSAADAPVIVHPGALRPAPGGHPFRPTTSPKGHSLAHHSPHPGTAPQLRIARNGAIRNTSNQNPRPPVPSPPLPTADGPTH